MAKKLILLFSHNLLEEQRKAAKKELYEKIEIIELPKDLREIWSNIDPLDEERKKIEEIKKYILSTAKIGDYVLVQGEWGYTYKMVKFLKENNYIPIYSSTQRDSEEKYKNGKIEKISRFKHVKYKKY